MEERNGRAEGSAYETASLGETSGDEKTAIKLASDSSGDPSVQIFRQSDLSRGYDRARDAAGEIKEYEQKIVDKYNALDIFRLKDKNEKQISFNDLTLEENLNYVKYNLKTSHDAFKLFQITQEKFSEQPALPAAILQKLATRSDIDKRNFDEKLFARIEYKQMLKGIKENLPLLDNKMLVDTVFALGKLHRVHATQDTPAARHLALNKHGDFKFF